ncbi:MAG: hypothetical protein GVY29_07615 [Spirochaetes bacterium]|jgi:hypothetical protein|nr:hypothetical protein [Spirochaetota bacterium]
MGNLTCEMALQLGGYVPMFRVTILVVAVLLFVTAVHTVGAYVEYGPESREFKATSMGTLVLTIIFSVCWAALMMLPNAAVVTRICS